MLLTTTVLPLGEVKSHLSELGGRVHDHHERVTVTVHGRPSAVLVALEDLERLPYRVSKRLLPPLDDRFSARRGTYRIISGVDDKARVITVVDVAHRRDVYRT
jgi:prevent-host-death family protein